jgi:hypothetical protein
MGNASKRLLGSIIAGLFLGVPEYKDIESSVLLPFLVLYLEVELFDQFFPIAVGEVSSAHEVVPPLDVLVVVELHDVGKSLVHQHYFPAPFANSTSFAAYLRISSSALCGLSVYSSPKVSSTQSNSSSLNGMAITSPTT